MLNISDSTIGRIVSLSGSQIISLLQSKSEDSSSEDTKSFLQIGALVKIPTDVSTIVCVISGLSIPMPSMDDPTSELQICELEMIGEIATDGLKAGKFRRGISISPSLGSAIQAATTEDIALVYSPLDISTIEIGHVHQESSLPAYAAVDKLLGRHFAILGNTGCGKSCAVSLLLRRILEVHDHAQPQQPQRKLKDARR